MLKFGDLGSICKRNQGRIESLSSTLGCPFCGVGNPRSFPQDPFNIYINWECVECKSVFSTDIGGVIFETGYDGNLIKAVDHGDP